MYKHRSGRSAHKGGGVALTRKGTGASSIRGVRRTQGWGVVVHWLIKLSMHFCILALLIGAVVISLAATRLGAARADALCGFALSYSEIQTDPWLSPGEDLGSVSHVMQ